MPRISVTLDGVHRPDARFHRASGDIVFVSSGGVAIGSMVGQIVLALGPDVPSVVRVLWEKADRLASELGYVRIKGLRLARSKAEA
jgi:NADPH-dependent curcumin reductase CurA